MARVKTSLPDDGTGAVSTAGSAPEEPAGKPITKGENGAMKIDMKSKKSEKKKKEETPPPQAKEETPPPQKKGLLSPFAPPTESKSRLKIFVWGESGSGKTFFSLQFPNVAIIDADNGTDPYKTKFKFDVKKTTNVDEVRRLVEWLATHDHPYTTLVIDPITVLWESLQKKWSDIFLQRNTKSKGHKHEFYEMQVRDWQALKSDLKSLIRQLLALDMNIVVTARSKVKYKDRSGDFMVADGETFDGDKSLPYMFDTVLHLTVSESGKRSAYCSKDRWEVFPAKPFDLKHSFVEKVWKKAVLATPSGQVVLPPEEEVVRDRPEDLRASENQIIEIKALVGELGFTEQQVANALAAREAASYDQLSGEQADEIVKTLTAHKAARSSE